MSSVDSASFFKKCSSIALVITAILFLGIQESQGVRAASANQTATDSIDSSKTQRSPSQVPDGLISLSTDNHFSTHAFVVDKSERTLFVYESLGTKFKLLSEHPADLGKRDGDKVAENDFKTPVGIYFLEKRLSPPEIPFDLYGSLAFTTDYPNIFDKRIAKGGSGIWLHAVPDSVPLTRGSRGCVVVRNSVIQELSNFVKLGQTPIVIFDKINFVDENTHSIKQKKYMDFFEQWRTAWETSDVDRYIQFYDETFKNDQMNYRQWYKHKSKLKKLYKFIQVQLSPPTIIHNKDQVVIRTIQKYKSDQHEDYGEKTIHAHYSEATGFKIIREDWQSLDETEPSKVSNASASGSSPSAIQADKRSPPGQQASSGQNVN